MSPLLIQFAQDESGFIISGELVLVATILVLGMLVGMSQVQHAVVSELNDVGHAVGALNQSYYYSGFHARKWFGWTKSRTIGSSFFDMVDACDATGCQISCDGAYAEGGYVGGYATCAAEVPACGVITESTTCSTVTETHSCGTVIEAPVCSPSITPTPRGGLTAP